MKHFAPVVFLCASLSLIGCDSGNQPPPPPGLVAKAEPQSKFPELKKLLETMASSGQKGEGFTSLQQQIDQSVRSSNATLADELMKDFQELSNTSSSSEIKTIAARMAGKL